MAAVSAFGASAAQANTYCANLPTATPDAACSTNRTNTSTAVQTAVVDAMNNPGPDTVLIGPGSFTSPTPMALYGSGTNNAVTIIGSGSDTVLSVSDQENPNITFDAGAGSSISDLTFFIDASATPTVKEGLVVRNSFDGEPPTVSDITIYSNPNPRNLIGVVLYSGSDIEDSSVDVQSASYYTAAVKADGETPSGIRRSYLAANTGAIQNRTNGDLYIDRSRIETNGYGARNGTGILRISNSLIENSTGNAQAAIYSQGGNGASADTYIEGSTIIANAGAGIVTEAIQGTSNAKLFMNDSVLAGSAGTVSANAANTGDSVAIDADFVALDSTKYSGAGSGTITADLGLGVDLGGESPGFVDPGSGDYRLASGSALIDQGQPAEPLPGTLDLDSNPRACHGTASGVIRRDIGAFEHKTDPNDDCTYPESSIAPVSESDYARSFALTSSKAGTEFLCSIDEGTYIPCGPSYTTHELSALGPHTLDVRAKDTYGNVQQEPTRLKFTVRGTCKESPKGCNPQPNCETDPEWCPDVPDTTAPKVIGVKVAKKTKARRIKVRFRSDEAGSTFKCKLNRAKWRTCKSPWMTPKLKKGKNTIAIQATDKAGNGSEVVKRVIKRMVERR